jgi:hypothetical protein
MDGTTLPPGAISKARWEETKDIMVKFSGLSAALPIERRNTKDYVLPAACFEIVVGHRKPEARFARVPQNRGRSRPTDAPPRNQTN